MSSAPCKPLALWAAVLSTGLAAAVMSLTLFGGYRSMALSTSPILAALSAAVAWLSLHWANETTATRVCLGGSVLASIVALLVSDQLAQSLATDGYALREHFSRGHLGSTLWVALFGAPPGLVFGALFALPIRRVHRLCRDHAVEVNDQAARTCGAWLSSVALGCGLLNALVLGAPSQLGTLRGLITLTSAGVALAAAALTAAAHLRILRRRRWFDRVQAGREPGWTLIPRASLGDELEGLQPLFTSTGRHNSVLVRHETVEGGGAYRRASNLVPWALVHLPGGLAALSFSLPDKE